MDDKKRKKLVWQLPFLALLIIGTILIVSRQHAMPYQHDTGMVFGTVYNITYQYDEDLKPGIEAELSRVDSSLSPFNKHSIISAINRNENPVVNNMFAEVFDLAGTVSRETDGAFDITVAPLVNMWGFGTKQFHSPAKESVDSLMQYVGYTKVRRRGRRVLKQSPRVQLDCSGIAKGYGCDVVADYLSRHGITNFMVEIGGEVVTRGNSEQRVPWKIGVTKPTDDSLQENQELETVLNLTDRAMATSGNYRNYYISGGKKFAHTIDPHTGYPVQHSLLSATVITDRCATADAYATAFMVMGVDKARKVLSRHKELMAYFIYAGDHGELKVWFSPSLKDKVVDQQ